LAAASKKIKDNPLVLKIIGKLTYRFSRKNRPFFTDINIADIAAPTLTKAAFHAVFKRRIDLVEGESEIG
jgi:hypothetical protein